MGIYYYYSLSFANPACISDVHNIWSLAFVLLVDSKYCIGIVLFGISLPLCSSFRGLMYKFNINFQLNFNYDSLILIINNKLIILINFQWLILKTEILTS